MKMNVNTTDGIWSDEEEISQEKQQQEFMLQAMSYLIYKIGR